MRLSAGDLSQGWEPARRKEDGRECGKPKEGPWDGLMGCSLPSETSPEDCRGSRRSSFLQWPSTQPFPSAHLPCGSPLRRAGKGQGGQSRRLRCGAGEARTALGTAKHPALGPLHWALWCCFGMIRDTATGRTVMGHHEMFATKLWSCSAATLSLRSLPGPP